MSSYFDRLNLRPQERRLVVGVAAVVFAVLNFWFLWPHFGDFQKARTELKTVNAKLADYERDTAAERIADLQRRLTELEGQGSSVLPSEQSLDLIRAIQSQAAQSGVTINSQSEVVTSSNTRTNEYFEEKSRLITVLTGEKELVDFLVSLGSTNSIIRVRSMTLRPDPSQTRLQGSITLVASYQKSRPKPAPPPSGATAPPARPATPTASATANQP